MLWRSDLASVNRHAQPQFFRRLAQQPGEFRRNGERFVASNVKADDLLRAPQRLERVQSCSDMRHVYVCPIDTQNKARVSIPGRAVCASSSASRAHWSATSKETS